MKIPTRCGCPERTSTTGARDCIFEQPFRPCLRTAVAGVSVTTTLQQHKRKGSDSRDVKWLDLNGPLQQLLRLSLVGCPLARPRGDDRRGSAHVLGSSSRAFRRRRRGSSSPVACPCKFRPRWHPFGHRWLATTNMQRVTPCSASVHRTILPLLVSWYVVEVRSRLARKSMNYHRNLPHSIL